MDAGCFQSHSAAFLALGYSACTDEWCPTPLAGICPTAGVSLGLAPHGLCPKQSPCFPIFLFLVKLHSVLALARALRNLQVEREIQGGWRQCFGR